ncbi:sporulation initiation factor Spo0A C-terminal domain-containing protein [Chakrabartyella piscis]|uniref:sporulation initiation factor Spo0A C-terminal domain-containing protein n=1 Tax=Chakrabartyella piscis TaxID=2918914 RepID=UPI002958C33F|nr:sporulation initiation factor Spo0A C-terminal domain-containing protein [Chakrabartyella piscis]
MKRQTVYKVILGNRDHFFLEKLKRSIERKEDLQVVGMTDSGRELVDSVMKQDADVILLDTDLVGRDGFWVMEQIKRRKPECICIMITSEDNDREVRKAIGYGADYYMTKPVQGELVMERIYQLLDLKPEIKEEIDNTRDEDDAHGVIYQNLEYEISKFLNRMGISASIKGYHFIRQAILITVRDEEALIGITKGLYPDIAKTYNTTANKVERAIRHAIESAWRKDGKMVYFEAVDYMAEEKPTNGQFIGAMTQYFRLYKGVNHKRIG